MRVLQSIGAILRKYPKLIHIPYFFYRRLQAKYTLGVVGIVVNNDGKVLLVEHLFHPEIPWGLPGGWVDRLEDPAEAVKREFAEELGLAVEVKRLLLLRRKETNHVDIAYECVAQGAIDKLSFELTGYDWFALDTLPHLHSFHYEAIDRYKDIATACLD